jgi:hypothetical protein
MVSVEVTTKKRSRRKAGTALTMEESGPRAERRLGGASECSKLVRDNKEESGHVKDTKRDTETLFPLT